VCDQLLIKVKEAARLLGFGRSMTYEFIRRGELKSVKVGGARRVLVSDLHEFVRNLKDQSDEDGD
jgi:excisionase family DNA binding protein